MKILVTDALSDSGLKILEKEKGFKIDVKTGLSTEELGDIIGLYDALLVRSGTKVTGELIQKAHKLKIIGRAGVGIDNVDVEAATRKGIIVMNTPGGNTISTAEHTMSLILSLVRSVPQANSSLKQGEWARKKFKGVELYGKTLGVIGMGRIGTEVTKRAQAFQMKILAYDPFLSVDIAQKLDVEIVSLDELFERSNIITIHVPITSETKNLINRDALSKMKDGVYIINCARGGLIDEDALADSLTSGKVAGAALDVFEYEPPKDNPLINLSNVVATPHLGSLTKEAQVNVSVDVAKQLVAALKGGRIINSVNTPSFDEEYMKQMNPYMFLGERLGLLLTQIMEGNLNLLKIEYRGEILHLDVTPVTLCILRGILKTVIEEVNIVNAAYLAKERGIRIIESKTAIDEEFNDVILLEATCGNQVFSVEGAIFGARKEARIVRINGYHVDAVPAGNLLLVTNEDKPGVIGQLSTLLGKNNINIAAMTVGRNIPGGKALSVIEIDGDLSEEILEDIAAVDNVVDANVVNFNLDGRSL